MHGSLICRRSSRVIALSGVGLMAFALFLTCPSHTFGSPFTPPDAPDTIAGPDTLFPNATGVFMATATDPDSDSLYIILYPDMGDTTRQSVFGPTASGVALACSTAYDSNATYHMRARARDMGGATSGLSPDKTVVVSPARIAWQFNTPDGDGFYSSPAIDFATGDTIVYCGCDNCVIYAFDARTGGSRGNFASLNEDCFSSSPAISADGQRVYIADDGGWLYCLSPTLRHISHYPPNDTWVPGMRPFFSTPAVSGNNLYIGRDDRYFYKFVDNAGQLYYWGSYTSLSAVISSSPAINAAGNRIVIADDSGYVTCFNDTLEVVWHRSLGARAVSSPAISTDGVIYVGCDDESLYSLRITDGHNVFAPFSVGRAVVSSPVIGLDSTVYVVTDSGKVFAVRQGVQVWQTALPFGENVSATPCLAPDTTLLINTDHGSVYALDARSDAPEPGKVLYRIVWPEPPFGRAGTGRRKTAALASSPTVGPGNGLFYAGSTHGGFFAVRVNDTAFMTGSLLETPWPKFHHDIQNRGRLTAPTGIGERQNSRVLNSLPPATIVRGVLFFGPSAVSCKPSAVLLDVSGRRVAALHAGPNDVSRFAPGVYFVRSGLSALSREPSAVCKVVIQR
jgi:outer membrane protein assembly factor BamB